MNSKMNSKEKRSIIVVGKTGAGKSKVLNDLIGENVFLSSSDVTSCTSEVKASDLHCIKYNFEDENKHIHEQSFYLNAIDTPGIADSEGRSKKFLNEIAQTIKTTPLNLIIILVEYGKLDTGVYANLEVLRECLNGMSESSSMLIINKVPTEKTLERKRKKGEKSRERKEVLEEYFKKLSETLGIKFLFNFFLENDESDEAELFNLEQFNLIRRVILKYFTTYLDVTKVKTWDEIFEFYTESISTREEKLNELKEEIENKLDKIELDIACNKYLFIDKMPNSPSIKQFFVDNYQEKFSAIECNKTEEEFNQQRNIERINEFNHYFQNLVYDALEVTSSSPLSVWKVFYDSFLVRLQSLADHRADLRKKSQSSIEEQSKILEKKKATLIRLQNSLENPLQN